MENDTLGGFTDLTGKFSFAKDGENLLVDIISKGFTAEGMGSPEEAAQYVAESMSGKQYLNIKQGAWEALLDYAEELGQ